MRPFTEASIPIDAQLVGIAIPDLMVLYSLADGARGKILQDRRSLARDIELGTVLFSLGYTIYLNKIYGHSRGSEVVLVVGAATLISAILAIPSLIPFPAESRRDPPQDPGRSPAQAASEPMVSFRIAF